MDTSLLDERTMGVGDKVIHDRPEPNGHNLGNNLRETVHEANGPEVGDVLSAILFRQESDVCTK
jgi:hypothetical protein